MSHTPTRPAPSAGGRAGRRRITSPAAVALALLLSVVVVGPAAAQEADAVVTMANFRYQPFDVVVRAGATVEWQNTDTTSHTVTASAGGFDEVLQPGETYRMTFEAASAPEVPYFCRFHGAPGVGQYGFVTIATEGQALPEARQQPTADLVRLEAGSDNVDAAIAWTSRIPAGQADRVILGRSDDFADVLAAGATGLPLLLNPTAALDDRVLAELQRLAPTEGVTIAGGPDAISTDVEQAIGEAGFTVDRIAGDTRLETAALLAARFFSGDGASMGTFAQPPGEGPPRPGALIARARGTADNPTAGFADAIGASAAAALLGIPVLLTDTESLAQATLDFLVSAGIGRVGLVGGTAAISEDVAQAISAEGLTVDRIDGGSRVDTAAALREAVLGFGAAVTTTTVVDGYNDNAWAQGFGSAAFGSVVVLSNGTGVPEQTQDALGSFDSTVLIDIFGPTDVVCAPGVTSAACDLVAAVVTTVFIAPTALLGVLESGNETGDAGGAGYPGTGISGVARSESGALCYAYSTVLPGDAPGETAPVVGAHIHRGAAGEAGDVVVPLATAPDGEANGCLTDVDEALVTDIFANPGSYYVNIHTPAFPAGAVRDNLFPFNDLYVADLSGDQEVPGPGAPMAGGVSFLTTNAENDLCHFTLAFLSEPATAAHVHTGASGEAGAVLIGLTVSPIGAPIWGDCIEDTDQDALTAFLGAPGAHYVNVHTASLPDGAIRGQANLQYAVPS